MRDAYLILENGEVFKGWSFGYEGEAVGELVFSTAMTDYLETLTDPCHYGQIVLQTFPLIGNVGIIPGDFACEIDATGRAVTLNGYIVREWCQEPSNFRSEGNLDSFLQFNRIPGLCGIDTRALTREIRENGSLNAKISLKPSLSKKEWEILQAYKITGAIPSCAARMHGDGEGRHTGTAAASGIKKQQCVVAVWDFGSSAKLIRLLTDHGYEPLIFGYGYSAEDILTQNPDGVIMSDGPGDPAENTRIINEIKKLCDNNTPIFAVGLSHQMLALANGARVDKLLFGHRGTNHPVRETETGRAFVTKQNHGYTVISDTIPETARISYINANDGTCEGIEYSAIPAFSVQFHPPFEIAERMFEKFLKLSCNVEVKERKEQSDAIE